MYCIHKIDKKIKDNFKEGHKVYIVCSVFGDREIISAKDKKELIHNLMEYIRKYGDNIKF